MSNTTLISDYENTFSSHTTRHIKLFENYANLSDEQKNAVRDWAKRFNLGKGKTRFKYAQYISASALKEIQNKTEKEIPSKIFVMEHIIPKTKYIIEPIIKFLEADTHEVSQNDYISKIIRQRLRICFITKEENKYLKNNISDSVKESFELGKQISELELFDRYFTSAKNNNALTNLKIFKIVKITYNAEKRLNIETEEMFVLK